MERKPWRVVAGSAALVGVVVGGIAGASTGGLDLNDQRPAITLADPASSLDSPDAAVDDPGFTDASPESADSPNESVDESADSPFDSPDDPAIAAASPESADSPNESADDSPASAPAPSSFEPPGWGGSGPPPDSPDSADSD
jgi:hypothetical protein